MRLRQYGLSCLFLGVFLMTDRAVWAQDNLTPEAAKAEDAFDELDKANKSGADSSSALLSEGEEFKAGVDPFQSGLVPPKPTVQEGPVESGLPGMRIQELVLTGTLSGAFGNVALLLAKDKQVYIARVNQKLFDGRVAAIKEDRVVFEQDNLDDYGKRRPPTEKVTWLHTSNQKGGR